MCQRSSTCYFFLFHVTLPAVKATRTSDKGYDGACSSQEGTITTSLLTNSGLILLRRHSLLFNLTQLIRRPLNLTCICISSQVLPHPLVNCLLLITLLSLLPSFFLIKPLLSPSFLCLSSLSYFSSLSHFPLCKTVLTHLAPFILSSRP